MAAAEMTETCVGGPIGNSAAKSSTGIVFGAYTVTLVTEDDWVIFDDFDEVLGVYAEIVASGELEPCTIDGSTTNKVVFTSSTTGAVRALVWGTKSNTN